MVVHQSVGCQLQAVPYYRRSVKKLIGLVTQNGDFDFNSILEKNHDFGLDFKNRYSTSKFEVWGRPIYLCLYTIRADVCCRILILKWLYRCCCCCCLLLSSFFESAVFLYSITLVLYVVDSLVLIFFLCVQPFCSIALTAQISVLFLFWSIV